MADPQLNYVSQTAYEISASYSDLPDNTAIVYVSEFGAETPSASTLSGAGDAMVAIPGIDPGRYYLSARGSAGELARTVNFYIAALE